jgi:hypothetical protein
MELTITQNGALYALQDGATKKYRGACKKRAIANKIIDQLVPESLAARRIQTEKICFI